MGLTFVKSAHSIYSVFWSNQKKLNSADSSKQLIRIAKFTWIGFSWLSAIGFILTTRYLEDITTFYTTLNFDNGEVLAYRLILLSVLTLAGYHFIPTMRQHVILCLKYYPYTAAQRFGINFFFNFFKLSILNIIGIWIIFFVGNPAFFSLKVFIHSIIQIVTICLLIFNLKELLTWHVPKSVFFFITIFFLTVALILIDLYIPSHILELDFIFLAIVLVFALLTEHTKIEKGEIGTVKAFKNLNYTLLSLPFRNSRTFSTIKFVIFMDAFSFFYYQFFSFDIFKRVMFFIMMFPLSIMTNYGNNIFGYAFKFSINVFSRPVDRRQIIKYYSMLIAIPYFLCLLSSTLFFGFYSNMFWYDIFGYLTVSMILLLVGYMLSLMKPLIIMEDSSWFGGSNQNKIALITSCTITVSWLFLFLLSYQWAFALGFIATFGLLTFIKLKFSVDKVASLAHLLLNQLKNSK